MAIKNNMSTLKEEVLRVHRGTERVLTFAGITKKGEFKYTHGGHVKPGVVYHIHYTITKREVYMTGGAHTSSSKIIQRISGDKTMYGRYVELSRPKREKYPRKFRPYPSDTEYTNGNIRRYFVQKANNLNGDLFEITEKDFNNKSSLFRYIDINWIISGIKSEVTMINSSTINSISRTRGNELLRKKLFPLQFWKPPKDSPEELQEKLDRRKIM